MCHAIGADISAAIVAILRLSCRLICADRPHMLLRIGGCDSCVMCLIEGYHAGLYASIMCRYLLEICRAETIVIAGKFYSEGY